MSLFDMELPSQDLDLLDDQLRDDVSRLPEAARKLYYERVKPRLRDPDTYAVLCWSLGLGAHHVYLRRWWSFGFDVLSSLVVLSGLILWMVTGKLIFPVLLIAAFLYNLFDTLYSAILSPRVVRHYNIRLGQEVLAELQHQVGLSHGGAMVLPSQERVTQTNKRLFFWALVAMAVVCLGAWLFFHSLLPELARRAAFALPEDIFLVKERQEAAAVVDQLQRFSPSQLKTAAEERLQRLFARVEHQPGEGNGGKKKHYHVFLRHGGRVGANAFAFPNGVILVTDELVQLAKTDEELLAILAHELGHLEGRHGIRILLQDSTSLLLMSLVTGDVVSLAGAVAAAAHLVLAAGYSQEFEREADQSTVRYFRENAIPITHFVSILTALSKNSKTGGTDSAFLSTHPSTAERIRLVAGGNETPH
ncbi:MAG: M48 family metallopeptidase [Magnetococcales bacterium]|nr:M48 family metallopeptidase [Magnetococcales bacterium]